MALIENAKGRREGQDPSGYTRLFGIDPLGNLLSRVQGAVISSGTELEKIIFERCRKIDDLDIFISTRLHDRQPGVWVASKQQVKNSQIINSQYEPDFIAFRLDNRTCYAIEVKDGDAFDTKKAAGEHQTLKNFSHDVAELLPFSIQIYLCGFNSTKIDFLYAGLKKKFNKNELLTGRDLCRLLDIGDQGYDEIVKIRNLHQHKNLEYFVDGLVAVPQVRDLLAKAIQKSKI